MPFDDAADLAAGVCASAIKPANDASTSPMKKALSKFMLAFVLRTSRRVQSHQCWSEHALAKAEGELQVGPAVLCTPFIKRPARTHSTSLRASCDRPSLSAVLQLRCAGLARAVHTTEDFSLGFCTMADNTAVAVRANRRQRVDRALETVESVTFSAHDYLKRLVIIVLANFASSHTQFVRARGGSRRCSFIFANET